MRFYKSACEFDETRVQDDYSVIGSEFCDFLSTVLTFRLIKAFDRANLLEDRTYKKVMSVLRRAKKARTDGGDWQLIRMNPSHSEILQELELIPKPEEPPHLFLNRAGASADDQREVKTNPNRKQIMRAIADGKSAKPVGTRTTTRVFCCI